MNTFDAAAVLLVFAATVGIVNDRWFGRPSAIALLIGALLAASALYGADAVFAHRHMLKYWRARSEAANLPFILLQGVLPVLLFAGTMQVDPRELRRRPLTVVVLATISVVLATLFFGVFFAGLLAVVGIPLSLGWCLVAGAILAPTDAVVVEKLLRTTPIPPTLRGVILGESLFNDGAAVVVFFAALAIAQGQPHVVGGGRLALAVAIQVAGGIALGAAGGILAALVSSRVADRGLHVTISLALALGVYRLAAALHVSGPITVVAAGLAYRFPPRRLLPGHGIRLQVRRSWAVFDDFVNTFLFLLVGFQLLAVHAALDIMPLLLAAWLLSLLARALSVGLPLLPRRATLAERSRGLALLTWAALRGGISVALALSLPEAPQRDLIITICFGIVVISIVVQGLLMTRVVHRLYPPVVSFQSSVVGVGQSDD